MRRSTALNASACKLEVRRIAGHGGANASAPFLYVPSCHVVIPDLQSDHERKQSQVLMTH